MQPISLAVVSNGRIIGDWSPYATTAQWDYGAHGARSLTLRVPRRAVEIFAIYGARVLPSVVASRGGRVLWAGRLETASLRLDASGSSVEVRALGDWQSLRHGRHTALWSTTKVDGWQVITADMLAGVAESRFDTDTNNRLFISTQRGTTYAAGARVGGLYYQTPDDAAGFVVAALAYTFDAPSGYSMEVRAYADGFTSVSTLLTITSAGAALSGVYCASLSARTILAVVMVVPAATVEARENGLSYIKATRVRVAGASTNLIATTLTANRAAGSAVTATVGSTARMYAGQTLYINSGATSQSEAVTVISVTDATQFVADFALSHTSGETVRAPIVYASEIAQALHAEAVALNPGFLSSDTSQIAASTLDQTDALWEDALPADILDDLAARGDGAGGLLETGVDELSRLYLRPKASTGQRWYARVDALSVERPVSAVENRVYATYSDPATSRALRTAVSNDTTSQGDYGLIRMGVVGAKTSNATLAAAIRDLALDDRSDPRPAAQIGIAQLEASTGGIVPGDQIRPGDTIVLRNLPATLNNPTIDRVRSFVVSEVTYDPIAGRVSVVPETPLPLLDVLLAQGLTT